MEFGQAFLIGKTITTSGAAGEKLPWTGPCLFELDTLIHKSFFTLPWRE
jgi:hypothetical protein